MRAQAEVGTEAKSEVPGRLARDVVTVGVRKATGVPVRRHEERHHDLSSGNLHPTDFDVPRRQTRERRDDARIAERLLHGVGQQAEIGSELCELIGVIQQRTDHSRDQIGRGLVPGD